MGFSPQALWARLAGPSQPTNPFATRVEGGKAVAYRAAGNESPFAKFFINGTVTIAFEMLCFGHFIEMLKIVKQTSPEETYLQITRRLTAQKGLAGTLDGFFPWGFIQCGLKGSVFGLAQAEAKNLLNPPPFGMSESWAMTISGGLGGMVQGYVMSPLLLLKTRVMTDPSFRGSGGVVQTAVASAKVGRQVIAREGVAALMKGSGTFAGKRFFDWTTRFGFVVLAENALKGGDSKKKLSTVEKVCAGFAGGALSAVVTIPIDVLVATFQSHKKAGQKVSIIETIKAEGNIVEFATRGLVARVAHVATTTMLMKQLSSYIYQQMYGK